MTVRDEFEAWKRENPNECEGISLAYFIKYLREEKEDNTSPPKDANVKGKKLVFERETNTWIPKKYWNVFHVKKSLYLSKRNYERLKNQESISQKVNRILSLYFDKLDKGELEDE